MIRVYTFTPNDLCRGLLDDEFCVMLDKEPGELAYFVDDSGWHECRGIRMGVPMRKITAASHDGPAELLGQARYVNIGICFEEKLIGMWVMKSPGKVKEEVFPYDQTK